MQSTAKTAKASDMWRISYLRQGMMSAVMLFIGTCANWNRQPHLLERLITHNAETTIRYGNAQDD
jgi:hypothetical protein